MDDDMYITTYICTLPEVILIQQKQVLTFKLSEALSMIAKVQV